MAALLAKIPERRSIVRRNNDVQLGADQNSASQDAAIDSALQAIDQNIVSEAEEADDAVPPESGEETSTDTQDDGTQDV